MATPKIFQSAWLYFAGALLLVVLAVVSQVQVHVPQERPPGTIEDVRALEGRDDVNLLFIVIDTLRADRMDAYGYSRTTSPIMAELASSGIRFAHVESQSSWTKASMASLWQGMYPERTGIQRYFQSLTEDAQMPAEVLRDAGFRTGGVWRNGWVAANFGFNQGFDLYVRPHAQRRVGMIVGNPSARNLTGTDYDASEVAFEFLESYKSERWFLYLHYMDVHQSLYADTSPIYGTDVSDFYDSSIHWVDRNVGMMVDALRDRNLLDNTMIVIVSDHGEGFFEHGQEGHARTLFREVQEVPFIIVPPFEIEGGLVVEPHVANVDVWPTILDLLGLPPLDRADGRSLMPLIEAAASDGPPSDEARALADRSLFSQLDLSWGQVEAEADPLIAMIKDGHRAIARPKLERHRWLYDHNVDPLERQNIAEQEAERYAEFRAEMDAFLAEGKESAVETKDIELDQMRLHQLRALGYVVEPRTRKNPAPKE
ncbi:MAG: sulfatase [Myxococcota bacterium]|jgi:arylsulfatase A-like enzyme|nr:sulfatase [Myxococcota bacterium]